MTARLALAPAGSVEESDGTVVFPNGYRLPAGKLVPPSGGWQRGCGSPTPPPVYDRSRFGEDELVDVRGSSWAVREAYREVVTAELTRPLRGALALFNLLVDGAHAGLERVIADLSQGFFGQQLKVSGRTVNRWMARLKRLGLVDVEHNHRLGLAPDGSTVAVFGAPASYRMTLPGKLLDRFHELLAGKASAEARKARSIERKRAAKAGKKLERERRYRGASREREIRARLANVRNNFGPDTDEDTIESLVRSWTFDGAQLNDSEVYGAMSAWRSLTDATGPP